MSKEAIGNLCHKAHRAAIFLAFFMIFSVVAVSALDRFRGSAVAESLVEPTAISVVLMGVVAVVCQLLSAALSTSRDSEN